MTTPSNKLRDNEFMSPALGPDRLHGQWALNALKAHYFGEQDLRCWRLIDGDDVALLHAKQTISNQRALNV